MTRREYASRLRWSCHPHGNKDEFRVTVHLPVEGGRELILSHIIGRQEIAAAAYPELFLGGFLMTMQTIILRDAMERT